MAKYEPLRAYLTTLRGTSCALTFDAIRVFTDVVSGKNFKRPGLAELIEQARPGDRLCVTRLDRLGRSLRELLETVEKNSPGECPVP